MKRYIYIILGIVVVAIIAVVVIVLMKGGGSGSSIFSFGGGGGSLPQTGTQGGSGSSSANAFGGGTGTDGGTGSSGSGGDTNGGSSGNGAGGAGTIVLGEGSPAQTFGIVSTGSVLDYFVDPQNNLFVIQTDGTVIKVAGGISTVMSATTTPNIISASFSYDGKRILLSSGDPTSPQAAVFNVSSSAWSSLAKGMQSPQWSPSSYQIAYLAQPSAGSQTTLYVMDDANLKKAPVAQFSLNATDLALQWIGKSQFVLSDKPTEENSGSVWLLNTSAGTLVPISYEQQGTESAWGTSATGTIGLLFTTTDNAQTLQLVNTAGNVEHTLSFITLPSKCLMTKAVAGASSTPYLYCGVPANQTAFTALQLPDSYNMMQTFTSDQIVQVNLTDGTKNVLRDDAAPHVDATDLKVFNGMLFFVNRYDGQLYALMLGQ